MPWSSHWLQEGKIRLERRADMLRWAEPRICAFDIETTKLPLQFPNSEYDQARQSQTHHFSADPHCSSPQACRLSADAPEALLADVPPPCCELSQEVSC